jgi:hypothetical protein
VAYYKTLSPISTYEYDRIEAINQTELNIFNTYTDEVYKDQYKHFVNKHIQLNCLVFAVDGKIMVKLQLDLQKQYIY